MLILRMKKIIVCTTINSPTESIEKFDEMSDWYLVVVGDRKTYNNLDFRICKHEKMNNSSLLEKAKSVLSLETDEHVIFAAYSRKLLQTLPKFKAGVYEDVKFSSIAYLKVTNIHHLKKKIYIKN